MSRFPGVVDDERLAVVHTREGELVALDLRTGEVRWREGRRLRPCALTAEVVVALQLMEPAGLTVLLLDERDGREHWRRPLPPLPSWVRPTLDDTPDFELACADAGDTVRLTWTARRSYRGGAPPDERALRATSATARGGVRIDLTARSLEPLPPTTDRAGSPPPSDAPPDDALRDEAPPDDPLSSASLPADVLSAVPAGSLRLELELAPGSDEVAVRAVDPATGRARWRTVIDRPTRSGPPRLRP